MASIKDKNVKDTIRFAIQLNAVAMDIAVPLAHIGYISEFTVQGIGPSPEIHSAKIKS